jgi:hypothetical protein
VATTKLVYIEWVDAVADAGWDSAKPPELHPCRTIGFVVSENKEAICIASTLSLEQSNARMHIPKKWIILRRNFKIEDSKCQKQTMQNMPTDAFDNTLSKE